jgi:tetratricopeptide (TPR) repeat protein
MRSIFRNLSFAGAIFLLAGCSEMTAVSRNEEGVQFYQQARYTEALKQFQEASYADSSNADAFYNLAATYHRIGKQYNSTADLKMAEDNYNLALDRNGNHTAAYRGLAVLLAEQGRTQDAFHLLEGWVAREPNVGDAKVELARLSEEYGDKNAAKEHLIEALAVQKDNPRALAALAKLQDESGNYQQALTNYQRSLEADNRQPQVAARLAALQSTVAPTSSYAPIGGTRVADGPGAARRY